MLLMLALAAVGLLYLVLLLGVLAACYFTVLRMRQLAVGQEENRQLLREALAGREVDDGDADD